MIDPRIDKAEFADLIRVAAGRFETDNPSILAILEKDYWVTSILCAAAEMFRDDVLLKGGTSLSKAYGLTQRFSEDVDLVVRVVDMGESKRDRLLKSIAESVGTSTGLDFTATGERGVHRNVTYTYEAIWSGGTALLPGVLLEMGTRSGTTPADECSVNTLIARVVPEVAAELPSSSVSTLAARRTLVEKLFVVHATIARHLENGDQGTLNRLGRHYYDLGALLRDQMVLSSIGTDEFWEIARDVDERGVRSFPRTHRAPAGLDFATSAALFPDASVRALIEAAYQRDQSLFLGAIPLLQETMDLLESHRSVLSRT